jgi:hypothetical protein
LFACCSQVSHGEYAAFMTYVPFCLQGRASKAYGAYLPM